MCRQGRIPPRRRLCHHRTWCSRCRVWFGCRRCSRSQVRCRCRLGYSHQEAYLHHHIPHLQLGIRHHRWFGIQMLFGWNLRCSTSQVRLCCAYWVAASRLGVVVIAGFVSNNDAIAQISMQGVLCTGHVQPISFLQLEVQPSRLMRFPSSHSSSTALNPSPHSISHVSGP